MKTTASVSGTEVDKNSVVEWLNRGKGEPFITKLQLEDVDISHPTVSIALTELLCCNQREWMQVIFRAFGAPEEIKHISTATLKKPWNRHFCGCCCNPDSLGGCSLACALARAEDVQTRADTNFTQQPCFFLVPSRPINYHKPISPLKRLRLFQQFDVTMTTSVAHCLQHNSALKELDLSLVDFSKVRQLHSRQATLSLTSSRNSVFLGRVANGGVAAGMAPFRF